MIFYFNDHLACHSGLHEVVMRRYFVKRFTLRVAMLLCVMYCYDVRYVLWVCYKKCICNYVCLS